MLYWGSLIISSVLDVDSRRSSPAFLFHMYFYGVENPQTIHELSTVSPKLSIGETDCVAIYPSHCWLTSYFSLGVKVLNSQNILCALLTTAW